MIVVCDTNILSSFAAGNAFPLLLRLFARTQLGVPPGVRQELQIGLERGNSYLSIVLQAIDAGHIEAFSLSSTETQLVPGYPQKLNLGEREALALAQARQAILLSNDKRAIIYCQQNNVRVISLVDVLRLLWLRRIASQDEVQKIIEQMQRVENLILTPAQHAVVFAPQRRR